jgi:hypothetical protein
MLITVMVLVPSGNAHYDRIWLSLIFRSFRGVGVPVPCNHVLLSLRATRCDRKAVFRTITIRCITAVTVISVITFTLPMRGRLSFARSRGLAILLFVVNIKAKRHC